MRFGAAHPISAERMVIAASASMAPKNTCFREFFIAITAAMKNVLSPIYNGVCLFVADVPREREAGRDARGETHAETTTVGPTGSH